MLFLRDFAERTDLNCFQHSNIHTNNDFERRDMTARVFNGIKWKTKIDVALLNAMQRKKAYAK